LFDARGELARIPIDAVNPSAQKFFGCHRLSQFIQKIKNRATGRHVEFQTGFVHGCSPSLSVRRYVGTEPLLAPIQCHGICLNLVQLGLGETTLLHSLLDPGPSPLRQGKNRSECAAGVCNPEAVVDRRPGRITLAVGAI
jgi:hypothetical protein